MIVAMTRTGIIGVDGKLPWRYPGDMQRFKELTVGQTVVMGRKTWDSIPRKFRPLPERDNIVVTRATEDLEKYEGQAIVANSVKRALELASIMKETWIIGGAQIYEQAMQYVTKIDVTWVPDEIVTTKDIACMPTIDLGMFKPWARMQHPYEPKLDIQSFDRIF